MINRKTRLFSMLLAVLFCLTAFSTVAYAGGGDDYEEPLPTETAPPTPEPGEPLSGESNLVTRDLLYDAATNKQFITVQTRNGNLFYLVIDYDKPTDEDAEQYETYFLNLVDERDLLDIIEDEEAALVCACTDKCVVGAIYTACPVCAVNMSECVGKEAPPVQPEPTEEPEKKPKGGGGGPAILLLLLALGGGGAFLYFKVIKNRPKAKAPAALDDYDFDDDAEDEGETLIEEGEDEESEGQEV